MQPADWEKLRAEAIDVGTSQGGALSIWRVAGMLVVLAFIAAACDLVLVFAVGPHRYAAHAQIGEEIGRWLDIFLVSGSNLTRCVYYVIHIQHDRIW